MSFIATRNPVLNPIGEDSLRRYIPSLFATEAHESRSSRFAYIPTYEILAGMMREGWLVVQARQGKSRIPGKAEFTKHLIRMRHVNDAARSLAVGDTYATLVLENAHDGTSAYKLFGGFDRLVCSNGMTVSDSTVESLRIGHTGDVQSKVIEGSFRVLNETQEAGRMLSHWQGVNLSRDESMVMAEAARVIRLGDAEGNVDSPIKAEQFLTPRRHADLGDSLWLTFNRIQENSIKGGLSARGPSTFDERGRRQRPRLTTTRDVKGIDQDLKVNRALWLLAERMAELKGAA